MAAGTLIDARAPRNVFDETPDWRREILSYGAAMVVVVAAFVVVGVTVNHGPVYPDTSEVDTAVMIDLPPAATAAPARDVKDGPVTEPAQSSVAQEAPKAPEPPELVEKPEPDKQVAAPEVPPPPAAPKPDAVLEQKQEEAKPPPPAAAAAAPSASAHEERAPQGSDAPTKGADQDGDDGRPRASPHAITQWQKSLMQRLEIAKRAFGREARRNGTVKVAFEIDAQGTLLSERIAESSGSPALDQAASSLVKKAAPFPVPPAGVAQKDMSFIVPIRFRH